MYQSNSKSFGLTSMINNTFNPNLTSFVFSPFYSLGNVHGNFKSLMICFVPRILIGVVAYYVYTGIVKLVKKKKNDGKGSAAALAAAGAAGAQIYFVLDLYLNCCLVIQ